MSKAGEPQGLRPSRAPAPGPVDAGLVPKLRQAWSVHQQGRLDEAERLYRQVIAEAPGNADALHFLGVLESQRGNAKAALALVDRAIAAAPGNAAAHYNRGNMLREAGRLADALASYDRVLALRPEHSAAWHNRGTILHQLGRYAEAVASFDRALAQNPGHADALFNRGNALFELGRHDDALASYARALAQQPNHAGALFGRGNALAALKRYDEAIASYDRSVALAPDNVSLLNNRGHALALAGRQEEALLSLDRAIAIDPNRAEMFNNRGNALVPLKRYAEAAESYGRALALRPDYPEALAGLGYALTEIGEHDKAIASFERLLALKPDYPYAPGMLIYAKTTACDWRGLDETVAAAIRDIRAGKRVATPLALFAVSDSPEDHARVSRTLVEDKHPAALRPLWQGETYRHRRIRLAYISADFNAHAVAMLMAGVFERHDRNRFEVFAISHGRDDGSALRARLVRAFEHFIDVRGKSDFEVASLLREVETDIAVDLTGLTGSGRPGILKFRPAGIQVQHLGFPGTMGAGYYDYVLADRVAIPEENRRHFSENVVYLPDTYLPNDNKRRVAGRKPARAEAGLPDRGFVFASFNNSYKFSAPMFDIWMRLLRAAEGSVLWLPEGNAAARRNLKREAQARGVDAARLLFAPYVAAEEDHLARLSLADLFLDTVPYNAHTTAADALWAGLPVLTVPGNAFPGRVAASLLGAAGLPELIAPSLAEYERLALSFARDPEALAAIRAKLARARTASPLFDTARFASNLEAAYAAMVERASRKLPPESFAAAAS